MKVSKKMTWEIVKKSFFPLLIFLLFLGGLVFYKIKIAPTIHTQLRGDLKKIIITIFIICVSFILQRIIGAILTWYKESSSARAVIKFDDKLISLLRKSFKVIIWAIAFLLILPLYGVNISAFIAALGIGSLAIALAAQDTIANVISGFMIVLDGPFRIGDKIKLPSGEIVEVLDIGIRRSKFLAEDNAIIVVPNLDLSKSKIINYTYGEERRNVK